MLATCGGAFASCWLEVVCLGDRASEGAACVLPVGFAQAKALIFLGHVSEYLTQHCPAVNVLEVACGDASFCVLVGKWSDAVFSECCNFFLVFIRFYELL